jgi:ArsR family transcriptional regulator, arsenate/arsenite/antimonite-responsive transcriptional repressor
MSNCLGVQIVGQHATLRSACAKKRINSNFEALSDPTRLQIYEVISAHKEMFCGQVVEKFGLTPGTISHHLKILADANLIETRREGQLIYLKSRPETVRAYGFHCYRFAQTSHSTVLASGSMMRPPSGKRGQILSSACHLLRSEGRS